MSAGEVPAHSGPVPAADAQPPEELRRGVVGFGGVLFQSDRLAAEDIIAPCGPDIVAARIKRADRRPQGWDLDLSLIRHDLTEA